MFLKAPQTVWGGQPHGPQRTGPQNTPSPSKRVRTTVAVCVSLFTTA